MKYIFLIAITLMVILTNSCYYDNEAELYPSTTTCVTDSMSYSNNILPILNSYCLSCHSAAANQGGVNMEGYDAVKIYVDNESFLKSIQHDNGVSAMPKNADKLDDCTIQKIGAWINQGALNN